MSLNDLPNEIILYLGDFLTKSSLNALIQTQTRFATLLTPHLYDDEIRFQVKHPENGEDYYYLEDYPPPIRCLECASHWRSDVILQYLKQQPTTVFGLTDHNGRTLLHRIAMEGNTKLLEVILAKGVDVDIRGDCNTTPLILAVASKNDELVDALLNAGADATASDGSVTVLIRAILTKSLPLIERIIQTLQETTNDIFAPESSIEVLHHAIYIGYEPVVRLLLDLGADFSTPDSDGTTALVAAASYDHDDIVNLLLDRGADVLPCDSVGRSPLNSACDGIDLATIRRLVKATLDAGGDISSSTSDQNGWTPLHHFVMRGEIYSLEILIESGANVLATDFGGRTPLTCALIRYESNEIRYEKMCRALIEAMSAAGGDLSLPSYTLSGSGLTPLHLAARLSSEAIVRLLLEKGADAFALDANQCLPVVAAALSRFDKKEIVAMVIAREMLARGHDFSSPIKLPPDATEQANTMFELATVLQMKNMCTLLNWAGVHA